MMIRVECTERRRYTRAHVVFDVFLRQHEKEVWGYGVLTDVSPDGAGIISELRLAPGAALALMVKDRDGETCAALTAVVRHVRPSGADQWILGCQFSRPLSDSEAAVLLDTSDVPYIQR